MESGGEPWTPRWVPSGRWIRKLDPDEPDTPFVSVFCLAAIVPSLVLIRRSAYCLTPGWDEGFGQPFEDTNLFLHVALVSRIHHLPEPLVRHRRHVSQSTADLDRLAGQERKASAHRALDDIRESINELRFYRERLFVPPPAIGTDAGAATETPEAGSAPAT